MYILKDGSNHYTKNKMQGSRGGSKEERQEVMKMVQAMMVIWTNVIVVEVVSSGFISKALLTGIIDGDVTF